MFYPLRLLLLTGLFCATPAFAKPKEPKKAEPMPSTTREKVVSVSGEMLVTSRQKPSYRGKKVTYTEVIKTYHLTPNTRVEVNGQRGDAFAISEGMVVSVAAEPRRGEAGSEEEWHARSVIASDPPKPKPTPTPPAKKKRK